MLLTAFAEATPMEKATELMKIMGVTSQIDTTQRYMNSFIDRVVNSQGLAEEKAKLAKSLVKKSMASSLEAIKSIDWEEKFAKIYAAEFTTEELQGLMTRLKATNKKAMDAAEDEGRSDPGVLPPSFYRTHGWPATLQCQMVASQDLEVDT